MNFYHSVFLFFSNQKIRIVNQYSGFLVGRHIDKRGDNRNQQVKKEYGNKEDLGLPSNDQTRYK